MQTISSTEATAPVIAFEHGHRMFLWSKPDAAYPAVVRVESVGLVTGVGWMFRTATPQGMTGGFVAPAHQFEAVTSDWIVHAPGLPSGWRHVAWEADEEGADGDGFWVFSGPAFEAPVVIP